MSNDYCYSREEAIQELEAKNVSPEWLLHAYSERPLKEVAKSVKIGHIRLRAILNALGITLGRQAANSKKDATNRKRLEAQVHNIASLPGVQEDLEQLTKAEFQQKYQTTGNSYEKLRVQFGVGRDVRTILATRKRDAVISQLKSLTERKLNLEEISVEVGMSDKWVKNLLDEFYPGYLDEIAERLKEDKYEEIFNELLVKGKAIVYENLEPFGAASVSVPRDRKQQFYRNLYEDENDHKVVGWMRYRKNYKWDELVTRLAIEVPDRFVKQQNTYKGWAISHLPTATKLALENSDFTTVKEFSELVPGWQLWEACLYFNQNGLTKYLSKRIPEQEKVLQSLLERFSLSDISELAALLESMNFRSLSEISDYLKLSKHKTYKALNDANISFNFKMSTHEYNIAKELEELGIDYLYNDRTVLDSRRELDFVIPEKKIAIEVNPTYTHNSSSGWRGSKALAKPQNYHLSKTKEARELGYELIHLYEWDLIGEQWQNVTAPLLKFKIAGANRTFYGRNVEIVALEDGSDARAFFRKYHAQGSCPAKHYYQFVAKTTKEVLGYASFGSPQSNTYTGYTELKRLAFLPDVQIRFGLSKLLSRFKQDHCSDYDGVISYSRNDMGNGTSYEKAGFTLQGETTPNLIYVNPKHASDRYSWAIGTPWSAKGGVLSRALGSRVVSKKEAVRLVEEELPWREGNGKGYQAIYGAGSRIWRYSFR